MKTKAFVFLALSSTAMLSAENIQSKNTYQYEKNQQDSAITQTPRTILDDEIAKNIRDVIAPTWLSHGYPNVTFDVNNGTINLRGFVDTNEEKIKLEQTIKEIDGVKSVNSEVTVGLQKAVAINTNTKATTNHATTAVAPTSSASVAHPKDSAANDKDHLINSHIREKLSKWSPKGYETIVIATSNGVVTISGNVERVEDIQKISNDIKTVDGVKSITNQISIKRK